MSNVSNHGDTVIDGDGGVDLTANALAYAQKNPAQFLEEMVDFLRIPSISTRPEHAPDVQRAAEWLADNMRSGGLENVTVYQSDGHPLVYADWLHAPGAPTVLFYGHYDVQPADNLDLWKSPPFEPEIRNDNIYARGCSDDKGQVLILVKAVEAFLQTSGSVPVNVKFLIEGEEESGGEAITSFLPKNRELLSADIAYVADTAFADFGIPSIVYGLRGMAGVNINVTGPRLDLHSGQYGGAINNPLNAMAHILAKLKDEDGHVLVPGFYDGVRELSAQERQVIADNAPENDGEMVEWTGAPAAWGEPEFTMAERLGARPTLDVNGIIGGYTGEGGKTIIPSTVHAKVTMRLVPNQNPEAIQQAVIDHVTAIAPKSVTVTFEPTGCAPASISDLNHPAMAAAVTACEAVWNRPPLFRREGGSIPIVGEIQKELGTESILLGFGLPRDRLHSPNERFHLPNFYGGIETVIHFLAAYANGA